MKIELTDDQKKKSRSLRGNVDRNKFPCLSVEQWNNVVPYVGTWIEIHLLCIYYESDQVVPYVGTWIEIPIFPSGRCNPRLSFPTWERG